MSSVILSDNRDRTVRFGGRQELCMMDDMPRKSDAKDRMIVAARRLFRERGYFGTALSDVVTESAAPRGSIYFPFPGGKEELAGEVTLLHAGDHIAHINRAAAATSTAAQLIEAFIGRIRDELVSSDYREGCAMAPVVIESTPASDHLSDATRRGFQDIIATLAARRVEKDVPRDRAVQLATHALANVEGTLIVARALRDPAPFDTAIALLTAATDASVS